MASLVLKKVFGRIEYFSLVDVLCDQGFPEPEIVLLLNLYSDQIGYVEIDKDFPILCGEKQGDTISSLLFNAATEYLFLKMERNIACTWVAFERRCREIDEYKICRRCNFICQEFKRLII